MLGCLELVSRSEQPRHRRWRAPAPVAGPSSKVLMLFWSFGLDMCPGTCVAVAFLNTLHSVRPLHLLILCIAIRCFSTVPHHCSCSLLLLASSYSFDFISSISFEHLPATFLTHSFSAAVPSIPATFHFRALSVPWILHDILILLWSTQRLSARHGSDHTPPEHWLDAVLHG